MIPYFAYATYLDPEKLEQLTNDAAKLSPARLLNWQVVFNDQGLATLEPSPGDSVEGALYRFRQQNWQEMDLAIKSLGPYQRLPLEVIYWGEKTEAESYCLTNQERL